MALHGNQCSTLTARTQNKNSYICLVPFKHIYLVLFTYHFADSMLYDCENSIAKIEMFAPHRK